MPRGGSGLKAAGPQQYIAGARRGQHLDRPAALHTREFALQMRSFAAQLPLTCTLWLDAGIGRRYTQKGYSRYGLIRADGAR